VLGIDQKKEEGGISGRFGQGQLLAGLLLAVATWEEEVSELTELLDERSAVIVEQAMRQLRRGY